MRRPSALTTDTPTTTHAGVSTAPLLDQAVASNYLDFYGLSKPPFGDQSDGAYILFASHRRIFELLIGHLVNGSGLIVVQGDGGSGKSAMLHAAGDVSDESGVPITRVVRPAGGRVEPQGLLSTLCGIQSWDDDTIQILASGPRKAVLIDDIDLLPIGCIDILSRLLRLSGSLAVVAATTADIAAGQGRPELGELARLARTMVRLPPIGPAEARQYIERSLWVAGGTTRRLMTPDALRMVVTQSAGLPGSINRIMEAAFTAGFARGDGRIGVKTLAAATGPISHRFGHAGKSRGSFWSAATTAFALAILISGTAAFLYRGFHADHAAPIPQPAAVIIQPPQQPEKPPQPAAPPVLARPAETLPPELMAALMRRGQESLNQVDIAAARLLFKRAAEAGNAAAAMALAKTYDPDYAATGLVASDKPDLARAAEWYTRAAALGDRQAADRLKRIAVRLPDTKK